MYSGVCLWTSPNVCRHINHYSSTEREGVEFGAMLSYCSLKSILWAHFPNNSCTLVCVFRHITMFLHLSRYAHQSVKFGVVPDVCRHINHCNSTETEGVEFGTAPVRSRVWRLVQTPQCSLFIWIPSINCSLKFRMNIFVDMISRSL